MEVLKKRRLRVSWNVVFIWEGINGPGYNYMKI